jgi:hypothetical protein
MSKMNWKGWLLLAGLVVGALGFAAWKFGGDYLQDARLESYAVQVENAANHKFDVLDIEISELAGVRTWLSTPIAKSLYGHGRRT